MKVQIIMPAINLWSKYTKPALNSIDTAMVRAAAHNIECRILFIDNGSTDETKEEAGKMVSNLFSHHRNEESWGFQKSVNFGVKDALERGYDIALVVNNDIIMHPEAIWRLAERFEKGGVGMVTMLDVSGEMKTKGLLAYDIDRLLASDKEEVEESEHPCFSAFAVDKYGWETIGEFDELYAPAYFEDNDYHYRMKLAELSAIVFPPSMFFHFGSRTNAEALGPGRTVVSNAQFEAARANYAKKWGGLPGYEVFKTPFDDKTLDIKSTKQTVVHMKEV